MLTQTQSDANPGANEQINEILHMAATWINTLLVHWLYIIIFIIYVVCVCVCAHMSMWLIL